MGNEELMVTIPLQQYRELVEISARVKVLTNMIIGEQYIDKEKLVTILGFEMPSKDEEGSN